MAEKAIEEWHEPSPAPSYEGGSSSDDKGREDEGGEDESGEDEGGEDESTSYEEEQVTPRAPKKRHTEEEDDPTYTPEKAKEEDHIDTPEKIGPSTRQSRTLVRHDKGRVSI
jgi:hypothetical protein